MGGEDLDAAFSYITELLRNDESSPQLLFLRARVLYLQVPPSLDSRSTAVYHYYYD